MNKAHHFWTFLALLALFLMTACQNNMRDQPRYEPLERSDFFPDASSARPLVPETIPNGANVENAWTDTGKLPDGTLVDAFPFPITLDVLKRGQQRFNIYCSPCHGFDGNGHGMIVQRGFSPPPSYHTDRLRTAPVGHFVDVITNGFGQMYPYGYRVRPADRWAIVAYIRALQFSHESKLDDLPDADQQKLEATP